MRKFKEMVDRFDSRTMSRDEFREFILECQLRAYSMGPAFAMTKATNEDKAICGRILSVFEPVNIDITIAMRDSRKHRSRTQTFTMEAE